MGVTGKIPPAPGVEYEHSIDLFLTSDFIFNLFVSRSVAAQRHPLASGRHKRLRLDQLPPNRLTGAHAPEKHPNNTQKNCSWCYKVLHKESKASYFCPACDVTLHCNCDVTLHCNYFAYWHSPDTTF